MNKKVLAVINGPLQLLIPEMLAREALQKKEQLSKAPKPEMELSSKTKDDLFKKLKLFYEAVDLKELNKQRENLRRFQLKNQIADDVFFKLALDSLIDGSHADEQNKFAMELFLIERYAMVYFEE